MAPGGGWQPEVEGVILPKPEEEVAVSTIASSFEEAAASAVAALQGAQTLLARDGDPADKPKLELSTVTTEVAPPPKPDNSMYFF